MTASADAPGRTFLDRQRDAAMQRVQEQAAETRKVREIVLRSDDLRRIGEIIRVGGDYVAEIVERDQQPLWTAVVDGKRSSECFYTVDLALLHLIALRHDPDGRGTHAHHYAARVLGATDGPTRKDRS